MECLHTGERWGDSIWRPLRVGLGDIVRDGTPRINMQTWAALKQ